MKVKDLKDSVDLIIAIENDTVIMEDIADWKRIKNIANDLRYSQGFYGRLYHSMVEFENANELAFPLSL